MNDSFENIHFGDKFSFKRNMDKNFMKKKRLESNALKYVQQQCL